MLVHFENPPFYIFFLRMQKLHVNYFFNTVATGFSFLLSFREVTGWR